MASSSHLFQIPSLSTLCFQRLLNSGSEEDLNGIYDLYRNRTSFFSVIEKSLRELGDKIETTRRNCFGSNGQVNLFHCSSFLTEWHVLKQTLSTHFYQLKRECKRDSKWTEKDKSQIIDSYGLDFLKTIIITQPSSLFFHFVPFFPYDVENVARADIYSLILEASIAGKEDIIKFLLRPFWEEGINANVIYQCMQQAIENGRLNVAEYFFKELTQECSANPQLIKLWIISAYNWDHEEILNYLLEKAPQTIEFSREALFGQVGVNSEACLQIPIEPLAVSDEDETFLKQLIFRVGSSEKCFSLYEIQEYLKLFSSHKEWQKFAPTLNGHMVRILQNLKLEKITSAIKKSNVVTFMCDCIHTAVKASSFEGFRFFLSLLKNIEKEQNFFNLSEKCFSVMEEACYLGEAEMVAAYFAEVKIGSYTSDQIFGLFYQGICHDHLGVVKALVQSGAPVDMIHRPTQTKLLDHTHQREEIRNFLLLSGARWTDSRKRKRQESNDARKVRPHS
jgi:ankyrin repeat protein